VDQLVVALRRARAAAAREDWPEVYAVLHDADPGALAGADLDALADAAWWLSRVEESIDARRRAYTAHVDDGADRAAARAAWMLSVEHDLAGREAVAAGWLGRARRHVADQPECVEQCLLAWTEAETLHRQGRVDEALAAARRMTATARRCGSRDLVAMSHQVQGCILIAQDRITDGTALLDEAMCAVLAGELSALFTGWIYCLAPPACLEIADLARASAWSEAAIRWCATLPDGNPFGGLCRLHRVEVLTLRGALADAGREAARACAELASYGALVAAEARYLAGEVHRRRGDLAAAEAAYAQAHESGRDPQPGLALLRLAQGRPDEAAAALRLTAPDGVPGRLARARLLWARVEITLAIGDTAAATEAAAELVALARTSGARPLDAAAATATGAVAVGERRWDQALAPLRRARALWLDLGLPYEAAQARMLLATACREAGDPAGAGRELEVARAAFDRLGAVAEARQAAALLGGAPRRPGGLSRREVEVLGLVAAGRTNRQIAADLVISEHTVARHVANTLTKLRVSSRAAAAALAVEHGLLSGGGESAGGTDGPS
jgi:DNA-binding CsgD family transcriptional regulator